MHMGRYNFSVQSLPEQYIAGMANSTHLPAAETPAAEHHPASGKPSVSGVTVMIQTPAC